MNLTSIINRINDLKSILNNIDYHNNLGLSSKEKQDKKAIIQNKVKEINIKLSEFNHNLDNILLNINKDYKFDSFIENLKNKSTFSELNPRIEKEKELKNLKIAWEKSEEFKRIEFVNYLNASNRDFLKNMYYNGPENIEKLKFLIDRGLDVSDSIYPIIRLVERGRTIGFIKFLIQNGLKLNTHDIKSLKKKKFFDSKDFLEAVYSAKQIDNKTINSILNENG